MKGFLRPAIENGFTLIETLIAITIIGIGIIALFSAISGSMFLSASSKHRLQGIHIARSNLDKIVIELKSDPINFDNQQDVQGEEISNYAGGGGETIDYTVTKDIQSIAALDNNCKKITCRVIWQEPATDKNQSLILETLVCKEQ